MIKLMTPGPTQVRENVRMARSKATTNPDLDLEFYDFYKDTCRLYSSLLHTDNESFLLSGEGILGLEAAVCSITEPGDRVLVLDNGVFGKGFADFVKIYGGEPVVLSMDYTKEIDTVKLKEFLDKDSDFKYATVVHCDTPSGMLNDIKVICPLLKSYGIMTVVDSVSGMFGNYVNVDEAQIDILCGGSQKALSAPIGITMVTLSNDAKKVINERKTPIASFYCNLKTMFSYYEDKWFPYSMPISDIMGCPHRPGARQHPDPVRLPDARPHAAGCRAYPHHASGLDADRAKPLAGGHGQARALAPLDHDLLRHHATDNRSRPHRGGDEFLFGAVFRGRSQPHRRPAAGRRRIRDGCAQRPAGHSHPRWQLRVM